MHSPERAVHAPCPIRRYFMLKFTAKYDYPDPMQTIDLQTGMAMRIWL